MLPDGISQSAGVFVELHRSGNMQFRHQNDLSEVKREMLDHMQDRLKHRQFPPLNHASREKIGGREAAEDLVDFAQGAFKVGEELGRRRSLPG